MADEAPERLRARPEPVLGILNGVDYEDWDPRHDKYLPLQFDGNHLGTKAKLKREFLNRLHLKADQHTPLVGIVSRMASQGVGAVVAVQGRRVAGILTDRDVALALGQGQATTQTPVKDVMTKDVVTIWEDQGIYDATQYFIGRGFRRLPIVNRDNELVGIVTFDDLVSLLAHEMINVTRAVDRSLARKQGG